MPGALAELTAEIRNVLEAWSLPLSAFVAAPIVGEDRERTHLLEDAHHVWSRLGRGGQRLPPGA